MAIRVDLHVHSKVSKTIPFQMEDFVRTVRQAMRAGLNGFASTEHFHSSDFWKAAGEMLAKFPYGDGRFTIAPGFHVLSGTELTVAEAADIIVIGPLDALAQFDRQFTPRLSEGHFPHLASIFGPARDAGVVLIGAHPTREGKRLVERELELIAQLDALEVNGKDMAQGHVQPEIENWAAKTGLPVVGSSDAHIWPQVGVQRTLMPGEEFTQAGLRAALSAGETQPEAHERGHRVVHICQRHKRIVKARIAAWHAQHARRHSYRSASRRLPAGVA